MISVFYGWIYVDIFIYHPYINSFMYMTLWGDIWFFRGDENCLMLGCLRKMFDNLYLSIYSSCIHISRWFIPSRRCELISKKCLWNDNHWTWETFFWETHGEKKGAILESYHYQLVWISNLEIRKKKCKTYTFSKAENLQWSRPNFHNEKNIFFTEVPGYHQGYPHHLR